MENINHLYYHFRYKPLDFCPELFWHFQVSFFVSWSWLDNSWIGVKSYHCLSFHNSFCYIILQLNTSPDSQQKKKKVHHLYKIKLLNEIKW